MLESLNPSQVAAALSVLAGAAALLIRIWGWVALARQQRRTMTAVATALARNGRPARAQQHGRGGEWSIEFEVCQELTGQGNGVPGGRAKGGPAR